MKANELMIGDWVCIVDDEANTKVSRQVHSLHLGEDIPYYYPIPLTPEILEANKAEVCYESCYQKKYHIWMEDDETCVEYKFSKQTEEYNNLKIYKGGGECVNIHALYVHELQHALRLCGLTELADNFKIE